MPNLPDFDPDNVEHVNKILTDNHVLLSPRDPSSWRYSWWQGIGDIKAPHTLNVFDARRICALYVHLHLAGVRRELSLRLAHLEFHEHALQRQQKESDRVHPQAAG